MVDLTFFILWIIYVLFEIDAWIILCDEFILIYFDRELTVYNINF